MVVNENMKTKYEDIAKDHKRKAIDVDVQHLPVNQKDLATEIMNAAAWGPPPIDTSLTSQSRKPPSNLRVSARKLPTPSTFNNEESKA